MLASINAAARSSASPPISPIITIASVSSSASNARRQSMCVVPMIGSPPIPTAVENPMSLSSYIIWYVSVPDFETKPILPSLVMSAGIMPAFDLPGEATPGQLGPTMRVALPREQACAQNAAVSCTGMPSVITITRPIPASTASITASLVPTGGTKTTETSAPVADMASATVPNTGTLDPPRSTDCPALRGLVPPTTFVPAAIMRVPCLRPSEPVMPWTMIRLCSVRKIAISCSRRGQAGQLGGAPRRIVHRRNLLDNADAGLGEYPPALGSVVAVEPHDDWQPDLLTALGEYADCRNDPVRDLVARGDTAEHVDQHGAHRRVRQHDVQAIGHDIGRRAAADVKEVRRAHAAKLLARVRDHVERRHHQAGTIADDADLPVKLDVVEVLGLGPRLDRVGRRRIGEPFMLLPERRVVVERDLSVDGDHPALFGQDKRVDLDQRGVLIGEHCPEPLGKLGGTRRGLLRKPTRLNDLGSLGTVYARERVDGDPRDSLRLRAGDLFDLHSAFDRADRHELPARPIDQVGQVVLLRDVGRRRDQDLVDSVAFNVHAENLAGLLISLVGAVGQLDAAGFAAPAGLDLGFHDDQRMPCRREVSGDYACFLSRVRDPPRLHGDAVFGEQFL